jgi:hypothetical protein
MLVVFPNPPFEVELPDGDHVEEGVVKRRLDELAGRLDLLARLAEHALADAIEDLLGDAHLHVALEQRHLEVPQRLL